MTLDVPFASCADLNLRHRCAAAAPAAPQASFPSFTGPSQPGQGDLAEQEASEVLSGLVHKTIAFR